MKKLNYWLWMPFLFIILYSVMVNQLSIFPFSWVEGLTSGERTAALTNALGEEEEFAIGDKVASVSGHKKGVEGEIMDITEDGKLHVGYDITIPAQQFIVGEYVVSKAGNKKGIKGSVSSIAANKDVSVIYSGTTVPVVYKQSELLMYYTTSQVRIVKSLNSYTAAIGDKVVARSGSKEGIEGEVTDISPSGDLFVTYNTTVTAQKFVVGDEVAASSGDNNRKVGTVTTVATNGDLTVLYDSGTTATYKQSELQMFYLRSEVQLTEASQDSSYKSTPSSYESSYDPDNLDTVYNSNSENGIIYYTSSYDSKGKLVYKPISLGGSSGSSASSGSSGSSASSGSSKDKLSGSTRGIDGAIDDSVTLGENSILADYTSPPDSATSVDANVDTKAPVADADTLNKIYQLLNSLIQRNHCTVSTYGCCKDNITAKKDVPGSNCSEATSVGLTDDVKKYIDTAVSEKTFTFTPNNSSLLQSSLPSPPTNQLSTQASYTNTVFLAPPQGNYMYPGKCPNPADCKTPTYSNVNSNKLPLPLVADFSQFGK